MSKRALIFGVTGQDGSYLAELLLSKGYEVHGTVRATQHLGNIQHLSDHPMMFFHPADLTDGDTVAAAVKSARPDEIYNLAAQTHVGVSFEQPSWTCDVTGLGAVRVFEAARKHGPDHVRVYQASTSELFGSSPPPQSEDTPFVPRSPYGTAKLLAHETARVYREAHGLWVACGILFNHESPRRHPTFVTRKISRAFARIALGLQDKVRLGNLEARRDWGHARDFVVAMWAMLQQDDPDDYVIATGETRTVGEFAAHAKKAAGLSGQLMDYIEIAPEFYRPAEVHALCGNPSKAREMLGWEPSTSFAGLVSEMVEHDLAVEAGKVEREAA